MYKEPLLIPEADRMCRSPDSRECGPCRQRPSAFLSLSGLLLSEIHAK